MERIISPLLFSSGIYSVKTKDIDLHLQSHPEYPSLRSITDTLDYFNVNNIAVTVDKKNLAQLPKMFLAHLKGEGHMDFALVQQLKDKIKLTWQNGNSNLVSIGEFIEKWNGTLLAVEKNHEQSSSLLKNLTNSNIFTLLLSISFLLLVVFFSPSLSSMLFSIFSLLGLITSFYIQKESFGVGDSTVAKVCGVINNNSEGCGIVIKSDQSKVFGISLGEISIVYFSFLLIIVPFLGIDSYVLTCISYLTLLAVAYTIFIQLFDLKIWCLLCLMVSTILISQFLILYLFVEPSHGYVRFISLSSILLVIVSSSWVILKTLWQNTIELSEAKSGLLGFKKNSEFFFQSLEKNTKIFSNKIIDKYSISFGAEDPTVELIAITNPTCGYCNEAFEAYDYLLSKFPKDVRVDFVFSVPTDLDSTSNIVTSRIIELYESNESEAYNAMKFWFENREVDEWLKKYDSANTENQYPQHCILSHNEWCTINGIIYTPETILGDAIFPKTFYDISDIEFFVETMKESRNQ